jgi:hypothetical protein
MSVPLIASSQDWLLPNLQDIPPDTMTVLLTDQAFIESYMVGLNQEMGRLLLWNGFPTDQRGTYFRQFWNVNSYVPGPSDPTDPAALQEQLYDIPPVTSWDPATDLGMHDNRFPASSQTLSGPADAPAWQTGNVVLLLRGELLRRYPSTVIYACKAVPNPAVANQQPPPNNQPPLLTDPNPANEFYPLYRGTLAPDLTYFGFPLTVNDALGLPNTPGGEPNYPNGVFFVFQQLPGEPRFGLEPAPADGTVPQVTQWATLSWANFHLTATPAFLKPDIAPTNVTIQVAQDANGNPINPNDPANAWKTDAAQTAYILMRLPARVAVLASTMLAALLPPTVTGLTPASGPAAGGTSVVISGSGFTEAISVSFGQNPASSMRVDSGSQITAVTPAGAAGTVDVTVVTPSGTSAASSADQFSYQ